MSTGTVVRDYDGEPLSEGAHVMAWCAGASRFMATVKEIRPSYPEDGDFRRLTLVRDDDCTEVGGWSDAVVMTPAQALEEER